MLRHTESCRSLASCTREKAECAITIRGLREQCEKQADDKKIREEGLMRAADEEYDRLHPDFRKEADNALNTHDKPGLDPGLELLIDLRTSSSASGNTASMVTLAIATESGCDPPAGLLCAHRQGELFNVQGLKEHSASLFHWPGEILRAQQSLNPRSILEEGRHAC